MKKRSYLIAENVSEFLDNHLKPITQNGLS